MGGQRIGFEDAVVQWRQTVTHELNMPTYYISRLNDVLTDVGDHQFEMMADLTSQVYTIINNHDR